jgi:disintegrin and metalloproteinase domain-containing protein 10
MKFFTLQQECTGSICLAYGLESCQCIPGPNDLLTKACELCCRLPGENQPCLCVILHYDIAILFLNILSTLLSINMSIILTGIIFRRSSFDWNSPPYDIPNMFSKPGTPCNDYNGYCDVFQKCREVSET